jgi:hypothetical protein
MTGGPQFDNCRQLLQEGGVVLYFRGPVTQEVVEGLGSMTAQVDYEIASRTRATMAFAVLVSCCKMSFTTRRRRGLGDRAHGLRRLLHSSRPDGLCLSCGNRIRTELARAFAIGWTPWPAWTRKRSRPCTSRHASRDRRRVPGAPAWASSKWPAAPCIHTLRHRTHRRRSGLVFPGRRHCLEEPTCSLLFVRPRAPHPRSVSMRRATGML